jgi:hypothetical protein
MLNIKTDLFSLAEKQLIKEKKNGIIPCYTFEDILEYAIFFRKQIDMRENKIKRALRLSNTEKIKVRNQKRREFYLQTGR